MDLNNFMAVLINQTPVQSMRINSTKVFIQLMEQEYNIPRDQIVNIEIDGDINESVTGAILENPHIFSCTILKAI